MKRILALLAASTLFLAHQTLAQEGAAPSETKPPAADAPSSDLKVVSIEVGEELEKGRPVNPATSFSESTQRLYVVVRVENPQREETELRVAFEKQGGAATQGVALEIPAQARWRTVARFGGNREAGAYRAVVRSADGKELAAADITISE